MRATNKVPGTWRRHNQFGDGWMYAIFTRGDRVAPRDVVPTEEEGVQLLGSMVACEGRSMLVWDKVPGA